MVLASSVDRAVRRYKGAHGIEVPKPSEPKEPKSDMQIWMDAAVTHEIEKKNKNEALGAHVEGKKSTPAVAVTTPAQQSTNTGEREPGAAVSAPSIGRMLLGLLTSLLDGGNPAVMSMAGEASQQGNGATAPDLIKVFEQLVGAPGNHKVLQLGTAPEHASHENKSPSAAASARATAKGLKDKQL